ncbi:lysostaphin resistance A-like protein [Dyella flava]|uniref:CPBP family intramembrane metalloprotease n=1 Tax=Dyella flava TaxID=1920170 RepID=A0ABS2K084_9GAMM|nr:CPBP family intramembrane glutamic endopeptidase [Dyella flava]MBM7124653.1 CPBP family intramembrane metalloprotease [Dyella flava]GLQ49307.1 membrane protein [Dyella flava]
MAQSIDFATPPSAPAWQRWLVFSPAARIVIYAALVFVAGYLVHAALPMSGWTGLAASPAQHAFARMTAELVPTVLGYLVLVLLIERRPVRELSLPAVVTRGLPGFIGGVVLFSTVVGLLWLLGSYHVLGVNPNVDWLPAVLIGGIGAGISEEVLTRGVLFRVVEEGLGTWWALVISAAFFGIAHIFNPGATWWSSLAIAIEAGILLALVFHVTGSLWSCIGLHAAWNITQGTIYGIPVSGDRADGWLVSTLTGPDWLSGGAFGAEASVVALATCSLVSLALLIIALCGKTIVPPSWRRNKA